MFHAKNAKVNTTQSSLREENSPLRALRFFLSSLCVKLSAYIMIMIVCASLLIQNSCSTKSDTPHQSTGSNKFNQYYIKGEQLYLQHCSNCHQKNGTGLGLVYPPLHTSDYMSNNMKEVICLIKNGRAGELIVNGKSFNQRMPGIPTLSDLEIAEIATYIYNTWSHQHGIVEVQQVSTILHECE